jgi:hypothetical protein
MAINVNIFGEYALQDLPAIPILSVTEDRLFEAIQAFVDAENAFLTELGAILWDTGEDVQTSFGNGMGGRMQMLGEIAGVEATRQGARWYVGFPIYAKGTMQSMRVAWLQRASLADLNSLVVHSAMINIETVISDALGAILRNDNYVFDDTQWPGMNAGTPTVYPLANNDGSTGSVYNFGNEVMLGTLNHYVVSGTANPTYAGFTTAHNMMRNVGNDTRIIHIMSRTTTDYVASNVTQFIRPASPLISNINVIEAQVGSPRARGVVDFDEVWEFPHFPDGYMLTLDLSKAPPLRQRESNIAGERGFQIVQDDKLPEVTSHPLANKTFKHIYGFGVRNRVNGVVTQFKASGAYDIPVV